MNRYSFSKCVTMRLEMHSHGLAIKICLYVCLSDFPLIFARSTSAVTPSEKCSIIANRKFRIAVCVTIFLLSINQLHLELVIF